MRPLYTPLQNSLPPREGHYNAGLWYDKFCDQWQAGWSLESPPGNETDNPKLAWIKTVTGTVGEPDALIRTKNRISALVAARAGKSIVLETTGPFVSGLGRNHPVENGFVWHHTLGVPYLPGSSVKGMVRAWVKHWWAGTDTEPSKEDIQRIFGESKAIDSTPPKGVSTVIFLDALPTATVQLEADIMTPHYAPYYSEGKPPADWYSPIPIPFLVVAAGARFAFGLLPRNPGDAQHVTDCATAEGWLRGAIEQIGAGAKTAVGYGRFVPPADVGGSSNNARARSEAATGISHGKAASPTAAPAKDELTLFRQWFDREGFVQGRKRGEQNKVMERIAMLADPKPAIAYVRLRLTKKDKDNAPSVWAWLQQQHGNGDTQS